MRQRKLSSDIWGRSAAFAASSAFTAFAARSKGDLNMPDITALNTTASALSLNAGLAILSTCFFLYISFRCIGITNHRKAAFLLIAVTALIFDIICIFLTMLPPYSSSLSLQLADDTLHMFKTLIILAVIAICAEGYLPRNFIVLFLYCDMLTTIPFMPHHFLNDLILKHYGLLNDPSIPGGYASPLPKTAANTASWALMLLTCMLVCRLFNRYLMPVLRRIPDAACLLFLLISFAGGVFKSTMLLKASLYVHVTYTTGHGDSRLAATDRTLILMLLFVFLVILMLAATALRQQLTRIIGLENDMLLDYYNNVAALHSSIRGMRHDLSNHLAALSFISSGESAADPGRQTLMSTSGEPDVSGAARAPEVSDRVEAGGDFSPAEAGGCTPPDDFGRCAEASRRALCGTGALRAPEDPGSCAASMPGNASCGDDTTVMPGVASRPSGQGSSAASSTTGVPGDSVVCDSPAPVASINPCDSYRQSLLDVCSEIDRQIAAQTAWQQIDTDALSSREKYEIYHYVTTVMQKHRIPKSAFCIKTETGDGRLEISLRIGDGNDYGLARSSAANADDPDNVSRAHATRSCAGPNDTLNPAVSPAAHAAAASTAASDPRPKPLRLPLLRHGTMFRLIKLIAQSHGGDAAWKKDGGGYALIVKIQPQS